MDANSDILMIGNIFIFTFMYKDKADMLFFAFFMHFQK